MRFNTIVRSSVILTALAVAAAAHAANPEDVYDAQADGRELIADAVTQAENEDKHVLITWGANWCGWCHHLKTQMESSKAIPSLLDESYVHIKIDLGDRDKHMDLAREYELEFDDLGIPHMTVLDSTGDVVGNQLPAELAVDAPKGSGQSTVYSQERILHFLKENAPAKKAG